MSNINNINTNSDNELITIQQFKKYCKENKIWTKIFPVTFIQAIYNSENGNRLDRILATFNSIFIEYKGSFATSVAAIDNIIRKKGLIITYTDENNITWTNRYKLHSTLDIDWQNKDNWEGWNFDVITDEIIKIVENIFNNINDYPEIKEIITDQIISTVTNILNNIKSYKELYNIFKELLVENINYVFNNIDEYPELENIIKKYVNNNSLFTIKFIYDNRDPKTLTISNVEELNDYIYGMDPAVEDDQRFTFMAEIRDDNDYIIHQFKFTCTIYTSDGFIILNNCYAKQFNLIDDILYLYTFNFNIDDVRYPMEIDKYYDRYVYYSSIPVLELDYVSKDNYRIKNIEAYNLICSNFFESLDSKYNKKYIRFILNNFDNNGYPEEAIYLCNIFENKLEGVSDESAEESYSGHGFLYTAVSNFETNDENIIVFNHINNRKLLQPLLNPGNSGSVVILDESGKISSKYLPSYVDDVVDLLGGIVETTPASGMTAGYKYYITSTKKIFTASSATSGITSNPIGDVIYIVPNAQTGADMYRWSGTNLVKIVSGGIVIGEIEGTAFDGARGVKNENILKSVSNKLITDVSLVATGGNDDVIIRVTSAERTDNNSNFSSPTIKDYPIPEVKTGRAGLMSTDDKHKLDQIYNAYIKNDELFFQVTQGQTFTLKTWGKNSFTNLYNAITNDKNVSLYLLSYEDGAGATFSVPCDICVSDTNLIISYVIPDTLKQVKATLSTNSDNDNITCTVNSVINLTETGGGGGDLQIGTTPGTAFEGSRGLTAEKNISLLQSITSKNVIYDVAADTTTNKTRLKISSRANSENTVTDNVKYVTLPEATQTKNGLLSTTDKIKLDNLYIDVIKDTENLFDTNENFSFTLSNWTKTNFNNLYNAITNNKTVILLLKVYVDAAEKDFNVIANVSINSNKLDVVYVAPDTNSYYHATLSISSSNNNVTYTIKKITNLNKFRYYTIPGEELFGELVIGNTYIISGITTEQYMELSDAARSGNTIININYYTDPDRYQSATAFYSIDDYVNTLIYFHSDYGFVVAELYINDNSVSFTVRALGISIKNYSIPGKELLGILTIGNKYTISNMTMYDLYDIEGDIKYRNKIVNLTIGYDNTNIHTQVFATLYLKDNIRKLYYQHPIYGTVETELTIASGNTGVQFTVLNLGKLPFRYYTIPGNELFGSLTVGQTYTISGMNVEDYIEITDISKTNDIIINILTKNDITTHQAIASIYSANDYVNYISFNHPTYGTVIVEMFMNSSEDGVQFTVRYIEKQSNSNQFNGIIDKNITINKNMSSITPEDIFTSEILQELNLLENINKLNIIITDSVGQKEIIKILSCSKANVPMLVLDYSITFTFYNNIYYGTVSNNNYINRGIKPIYSLLGLEFSQSGGGSVN